MPKRKIESIAASLFSSIRLLYLRLISILFIGVSITTYTIPTKSLDDAAILISVAFILTYLYYMSTIIYVLRVFLREIKQYLETKKTVLEKEKPVTQNELSENFSHIQSSRNTTSYSKRSIAIFIKGFIDITKKRVQISDEIQKIYDKVTIVNQIIVPFLLNGFIVNILFAGWYYIRRKIVFFLYLQLTLVIMISIGIIWSLLSVTKTQPSLKSNLIANIRGRPYEIGSANSTGKAFKQNKVQPDIQIYYET